ncbi:transporter [Planobispora takensis]|uniref:Transporter n=2 Tax=Planobispora takensis TaxID=1367882 RepID=A0A8J3WVW6_9ACTN|nr:transporter [Planobispora takensis]
MTSMTTVLGTMAGMKLAVLRHSMSGQKAGLVATGGVLGLVLAGGTLFTAFQGGDLLAAAYAVWMLGWILGPVFSGGGDETLRPEYFTLLGLPPRRLAAGLLAGAFVGVAPAVNLLALTGLVVFGVRQSPAAALVALPAMILQLAIFVLLSRVAVAALGIALRSRLGAIGTGLVNGAILAALGQVWVFAIALGQTGGITPGASAVLRYLPSGWGLAAVEGAGTGRWDRTGLALGAMAVLVALLLAAWAALLTRRASAARASARGRRPMTASTASGAVVAKELRTWSRDLVRTHQLTFALAYGVFFAAAPLLLGLDVMLAWAGPVAVLMAAAMTAGVYAVDGTALWLTLMVPAAADVRGRQRAWLLVVGPPVVALSLALTAVTGGPWPPVLAVTAALLGGGAGIVPLISVYALVPGTDPHRRGGNPLRVSEDDGALTGMAYAVLALVALTGAPAAVVAVMYGWPGVAVGVATGVLCWWGFGLLAQRRLHGRGPELLQMMRTGKRPPSGQGGWVRIDELPKREQIITAVCWSVGAIPLFPQGIVAGFLKAQESETRSWFLALHLPEAFQWPVIVFMVLLGLGIYGLGLWIPYRHRRRAVPEAS